MNISGIRPYGGAYDYNSIQGVGTQQSVAAENASAIKGVSAAEGAPSTAGSTASAEQNASSVSERDYGKQTFGAVDFARQYQPETSYELKGVDSDIHSLDMERAISDLQKDQVLQQYQFFIGESRGQNDINSMADAGARSVRAMENFDF